jgi:two-component system sensor histidine kinase KdpD
MPIRDLIVLAAGLLAVAGATMLLGALPDVSVTTVALLFLLVVLGTAALARLWAAIIVSIAAMLTLNFLFLPPVGTFTIADPQNWIALIVFLVVAVIASNLSAAAKARTREAIERRNELTRLFDLTRDVLLTTETRSAMDALARHIARRFDLTTVAICLPADHGWRIHQGGVDEASLDTDILNKAMATARGTLEFDARQRAYGGHVRAGGENGDVIVPLRHGTKAVGLLAAAPPTLDIGTLDAVAGVVAIAIERVQFLTERDAAELVRQKADLASTLLASLSHDLRTPLTALKVAVANLRGELPAEQRREQADAAIVELDRLTRLFQDILDMARIDAAALRVERQWVSAADVVDAAIAHVQISLAHHVVRVDAGDDREVQIDPRLTSVALSHVLENAARYSPAGTEILVHAETDHRGLQITVTDHGPGLDPSELNHLFERFYRGRAARQTTPGTGMGLSLTRGMLAAAGGHVWAENVPGAGARFSIVVPGAVRPASVTS